MTKNKITIISLIILFLLSVFMPVVNANNETTTEQIVPISEPR